LHGAGVLDITPTVLAWFGLPIGDDMEGRVLMESFQTALEVTRVESWDLWMGISPSPASAEVEPSNDKVVVKWRYELDWNFVQSCLEASRYEAALPVLHRLFSEFPERVEISHALFHCQLASKQTTDAAETMEVVLEGLPPNGVFSLLTQAELAVAQSNSNLARSLAGQALKLNPEHPMALRKLGLLLLRLREWNSLAEVAKKALALDEQEPIAWLGLAMAQLRKGNAAEAVDAASRAIGLKFFLPDAHFVMARALVAQGRWQEAKEAMQTLMKLQPQNRAAATYFKRIPV
jgi:tetratricopeptide (TPR) repeat protein